MENNEGRVCDAVIRLLEAETGQQRSDVSHPERAGEDGPVDVLFELGAEQYALEHTRIEAFPNQMQFDRHFLKLIDPVTDRLSGNLPVPGRYDLIFPLEMRFDDGWKRLEFLQAALIEWVHTTALALHTLHPKRLGRDICPRGIRDRYTGRPEGFPFDVTLVRSVHWSESGEHDGILFAMRIEPKDLESLRKKRIETAIAKKRDKLAFRKANGARAVLVLENSDMILTNHALVGEHIAEVLGERPCWLDELLFTDTTTSRWTLLRWQWDSHWWEDEYREFNPDDLDDACAK